VETSNGCSINLDFPSFLNMNFSLPNAEFLARDSSFDLRGALAPIWILECLKRAS
jgi:hypothetical protein